MQKVEFADAGGDTISLVKHPNGVLMDVFFGNVDFNAISSLSMRDDDILICSYPRSGVHWLREQMQMILEGTTDVQHATDKEAGMFEFQHMFQIDKLPAPRILSSHFRFELLPVDILKKRTKIVLLYRNPKDVAVSFYNFHGSFDTYQYSGQFGNYLKLFQEGNLDWGSYADYLSDWVRVIQQHPQLPVHLISYEGLKETPTEELKRLSEFLGKEADEDFLGTVSEACTIDKQRARKDQFWKSGDLAESKGLNIIYRKGESGGWKNWFTVAQNEQFDIYWAKVMADLKIFNFKSMS